MCFSVKIEKDLEKLAREFRAEINWPSFTHLQEMRIFETHTAPEVVKFVMGLKRKASSSLFKESQEDGRIYPGYFAPVIVSDHGKRLIQPMRYRVRPAGSKEEIPTQYNVFNARLDSLETRKTWSSIFLKKHCLLPFTSFYEWVEVAGAKKLINFIPQNRPIMWAPGLYDEWESPDKKVSLQSFAIITSDPPPEIQAQGHDRCPVFLSAKNIDSWLAAEKLTKPEAYRLLETRDSVYFEHQF